MNFTNFGPLGPALSLLAVAGVIVSYFLLRREMQAELAKLREMIRPTTEPEIPRRSGSGVAINPDAAVDSPAAKAKQPTAPELAPSTVAREEVTPEILAIITAAIAQFIGAGARIRSTRLLTSPGGISPWAQQGRVIIQASHNLGMR